MPGILELLIVGLMFVCPAIVVVALWKSGKLGGANNPGPTCSQCQTPSVPMANYCHHCGAAIKPPKAIV